MLVSLITKQKFHRNSCKVHAPACTIFLRKYHAIPIDTVVNKW